MSFDLFSFELARVLEFNERDVFPNKMSLNSLSSAFVLLSKTFSVGGIF